VIVAVAVASVVAVVLVGGVAWLMVQDAKADDRVSMAWRDEHSRDRRDVDG
jgi:hypothetical protein